MSAKMVPFTTIPVDDINLFLGQHLPMYTKGDYDTAFKIFDVRPYLKTDSTTPLSVRAWFQAKQTIRYLTDTETTFAPIPASKIFAMSNPEVEKLNRKLLIPGEGKAELIRVLANMNLLINDMSSFDLLPDEILSIMVRDYDCDALLDLCTVSQRFENFCRAPDFHRLLADSLKWVRLDISQFTEVQLRLLCQSLRTEKLAFSQRDMLVFKFTVYKLSDEGKIYTPTGETAADVRFVAMTANDIEAVALTEAGDIHSLTKGYMLTDTRGGYISARGHIVLVLTYSGTVRSLTHGTVLLENIIRVAAGTDEAVGLDRDGTVHIYNFVRREHAMFNRLPKMVDIAAGAGCVFCLTTMGQVFAIGNNSNGKLGIGNTEYQYRHVLLPTLSNIIQVVCAKASETTLFLTSTGKVYACGDLSHTETHLNNWIVDASIISIPQELTYLSNIKKMNSEFVWDGDGNISNWKGRFRRIGQSRDDCIIS